MKFFPNPIFDDFTVSYSTETKTDVTISIYDIGGNKVMEPVNINQIPGMYEITISKGHLRPGFYTLIFQTDQVILSRKILVMTH